MTIFWHPTGPLIRYANGAINIEDLNPEIKTTWRLSRYERAKIGIRFLLASLL